MCLRDRGIDGATLVAANTDAQNLYGIDYD